MRPVVRTKESSSSSCDELASGCCRQKVFRREDDMFQRFAARRKRGQAIRSHEPRRVPPRLSTKRGTASLFECVSF